MRKSSSLGLAITGTTIALAVAGCGDPITANHDWTTLDAVVTVTQHVGSSTTTGSVLVGRIVDAKGRPLVNTLVQETCVKVSHPSSPGAAYKCLALINTSERIYVAGGMASGLFSTLPDLSGSKAPGSLSFAQVPSNQPSNKPVHVKVSAIKG